MWAAVTTRSGATRKPVPVKLLSHLVTLNCPTPDCTCATTSGQLLGTASLLGLGLGLGDGGLWLGVAGLSIGAGVCGADGAVNLVEESGEGPGSFVQPAVQRHKLTTAATAQKMMGLRLVLTNCLPLLKERDNSRSTWCEPLLPTAPQGRSQVMNAATKVQLRTWRQNGRPLHASNLRPLFVLVQPSGVILASEISDCAGRYTQFGMSVIPRELSSHCR